MPYSFSDKRQKMDMQAMARRRQPTFLHTKALLLHPLPRVLWLRLFHLEPSTSPPTMLSLQNSL